MGACIARMGTKKRFASYEELDEKTRAVIADLFTKLDENKDGNVDRSEAEKFWQGKYPKVNANMMFGQTDEDVGGTISHDEFQKYWLAVANAGYNEKEIVEEIEEIMQGSAWRDWGRVSITGQSKGEDSKA